MPAQLRKCKECGKTFLPKGREQYCSDIHYRPCPICGTPVEVKYFADPPRKCDNCKHAKSISTTIHAKQLVKIEPKSQIESTAPASKQEESSVAPDWTTDAILFNNEGTVDPDNFCEKMSGIVMYYVGNQYKNCFQTGHKYLIKVERSDYVYNVTSTEDVTTGESCDIELPIASQISFYQKFGKVKEVQQ